MAGPNLPVNIDSTYADDGGDASVKTHQQHHDTIHTAVNKISTSIPSDGQVAKASSGVYEPANLEVADLSDHDSSEHGYSVLDSRVGLVIVETSTGVWSGDAPSRTGGEYPITFIGATDPTDGSDGIDTPANINDYDTWIDTSA